MLQLLPTAGMDKALPLHTSILAQPFFVRFAVMGSFVLTAASPCCCIVLLLLPMLLLLLLLLPLRQVYTPVPCPFDDMCSFHSREYLEGLKSVDAPKVTHWLFI
jgi:hypothetical protein